MANRHKEKELGSSRNSFCAFSCLPGINSVKSLTLFRVDMSISLMHGIVAGGAAVYLQNRLQEEAAENDAGSWSTVALQVNHLLLLTAETLCFAVHPLGAFKTFVQAVYVLTPLSLIAPLAAVIDENAKLALSPKQAQLINKIYRIAVASLSLAALALGDPYFAAGSLAMLAIDLATSKSAHQVFTHLAKIPALCALIGYGSQVFCSALRSPSPEILKVAAVGSTVLMSIKLCLIDSVIALNRLLPETASKREEPSFYQYPFYSSHCYHQYPGYTPPPPSHSFGGGNPFCRASVW